MPRHFALWGFCCLNMANSIPPPPFLSVSLLESMRSGGAIPPPPQKGYLSDTFPIPHEIKANGCDSPLCNTISKRCCAIWGGISHWAAKTVSSTAIGSQTQGATKQTDSCLSGPNKQIDVTYTDTDLFPWFLHCIRTVDTDPICALLLVWITNQLQTQILFPNQGAELELRVQIQILCL